MDAAAMKTTEFAALRHMDLALDAADLEAVWGEDELASAPEVGSSTVLSVVFDPSDDITF